MSSNLACVGLGVADHEELTSLAQAALDHAEVIAEPPGSTVWRWQDPSGARLVITLDDDGVVADLLPSFAGRPGARLAGCVPVHGALSRAAVVDSSGEQTTAMAFGSEQQRVLMAANVPYVGEASVSALAVDVTVHPDETSFAASEASLLDPTHAQTAEPAPPEYVERGWPWPPRMAATSFVSHGVMGEAADADAHAWLAGTVITAERRTVAMTGQSFIRARVATVGFEADVCMATDRHHEVPQPGAVVSGTVYLVASLDGLTFAIPRTPGARAARRRRWFSRA